MRIPGWLFVAGIVVVVGITGLFSVAAFTVARQVAIDSGNIFRVEGASPEQVARTIPTFTPIPTAIPQPTATTRPGETPQPTEAAPTATSDPAGDYTIKDPRRINILLLGIDQRSGVDDPGPFRTDTMMVASIDPVKKTVGVLSIPRDLWVKIPGYQSGRINTANSLGDANSYPGGGGPALAAETIRQNLGIRVDKYIRINFSFFTKAVSLIAPDGVEICVKDTIDDPNYPDAGYGFIHVHFDPGCQKLDPEHLLQYARTRHTQNSDFDRARRQQEVLRALRDKLLSVGGITNFIGQAPTLWSELAGSFTTNLTMDEALSIARLVQDVPKDNFHFGVIDTLYVDLATTSSGDQVLIPRTNAIRTLLQQVFDAEGQVPLADLRARADTEKATISVFNNTDTAGLANQTRDWLGGKGVTVAAVGNTAQPSNSDTVIRVYTDKVQTAKYLAALLGISTDRIQPGGERLGDSDIVVIVGPDIKPLLSKQ
jgi:LCP family protein required for cell wall assembly